MVRGVALAGVGGVVVVGAEDVVVVGAVALALAVVDDKVICKRGRR